MKSLALVSNVAAFVAIVLGSSQSSAKQGVDVAAEKLFRQALAAAVKGDSAQHDRLLAESLERYPEYELARWYSGQVHYDGQWKSIDAVSQLVSSDPRWEEYQTRLSQVSDNPQAHASMARWCHSQNLLYEEKWHWLNVLSADHDNREALGSLGLKIYHGQYLSPEQIDDYKLSEKKAEADFKKFSKQYGQWINTAIRGSSYDMDSLVKKIAAISDTATIPALLDTFYLDDNTDKLILKKLGTESGDESLAKLRRAVIQALNEMSQQEATWALLQIAVEWPEPAISTFAAEALKYREKTSFMPALMGAISSPLEAAISVRVAPNGQVSVYEDIEETHPLVKNNHFRSSKYLTQYTQTVSREIPGSRTAGPHGRALQAVNVSRVWSDRRRDIGNAMAQASNTQNQIDAENASRTRRNTQVQNVLKIVTGEDLGSEPIAWWNAWNHYNELNTPEELPVYETAEVRDYSRNYVQNYTVPSPSVMTHSCFVAGTPVWTQAGPVAIETVQVGDMVLSQDPFSGELDYRPVMETSIGPPSPILNLTIENETLSTTRGHRFWIANTGWKMAKFLEPGNRLVALQGYPELQKIEKGQDREAFNLVVGQFHTFFVGNQKLLVHDKNCPLPTTNPLPGVKQLSASETASY